MSGVYDRPMFKKPARAQLDRFGGIMASSEELLNEARGYAAGGAVEGYAKGDVVGASEYLVHMGPRGTVLMTTGEMVKQFGAVRTGEMIKDGRARAAAPRASEYIINMGPRGTVLMTTDEMVKQFGAEMTGKMLKDGRAKLAPRASEYLGVTEAPLDTTGQAPIIDAVSPQRPGLPLDESDASMRPPTINPNSGHNTADVIAGPRYSNPRATPGMQRSPDPDPGFGSLTPGYDEWTGNMTDSSLLPGYAGMLEADANKPPKTWGEGQVDQYEWLRKGVRDTAANFQRYLEGGANAIFGGTSKDLGRLAGALGDAELADYFNNLATAPTEKGLRLLKDAWTNAQYTRGTPLASEGLILPGDYHIDGKENNVREVATKGGRGSEDEYWQWEGMNRGGRGSEDPDMAARKEAEALAARDAGDRAISNKMDADAKAAELAAADAEAERVIDNKMGEDAKAKQEKKEGTLTQTLSENTVKTLTSSLVQDLGLKSEGGPGGDMKALKSYYMDMLEGGSAREKQKRQDLLLGLGAALMAGESPNALVNFGNAFKGMVAQAGENRKENQGREDKATEMAVNTWLEERGHANEREIARIRADADGSSFGPRNYRSAYDNLTDGIKEMTTRYYDILNNQDPDTITQFNPNLTGIYAEDKNILANMAAVSVFEANPAAFMAELPNHPISVAWKKVNSEQTKGAP